METSEQVAFVYLRDVFAAAKAYANRNRAFDAEGAEHLKELVRAVRAAEEAEVG